MCDRAYLCLVHVVVVSLVGAADDHDNKVLPRVQAEVVHRRLEEVAVLGEPFTDIEGWCEGHGGETKAQLWGGNGRWMVILARWGEEERFILRMTEHAAQTATGKPGQKGESSIAASSQ